MEWYYFLIFFVILLIVSIILREVTCWYWKINEGLNILRSIDSKLTQLSLHQNILPHSVHDTIFQSESIKEETKRKIISSVNDIEVKGFKEKFSSYPKSELMIMKVQGLKTWSEKALIAVDEILRERG